jgi:autotransporter-associated beta strand protein
VRFNNAVSLSTLESGTVAVGGVARTLTLSGTNAGNNTVQSVIGDATVATGVGTVNVAKTGSGKWIATGANTYTGTTSVAEGILSITNAFLANTADVRMSGLGVLDLNFVGSDVIDELFLDGVGQASGTWGAIGNAGATFQSAHFTGTGILQVTTPAAVLVQGDYNGNGIVDAADYVLWRNGGPLLNDPTPGVQAADYDFWRSRFGATTAAGSGSNDVLSAVPEPTTGILLFVLLSGMTALARWQRRPEIG